MSLTPTERHRMVVDAAIFGIRPAARTYGVAASTVYHWLNHPDYSGVVERAREAVQQVARDMRLEANPLVGVRTT